MGSEEEAISFNPECQMQGEDKDERREIPGGSVTTLLEILEGLLALASLGLKQLNVLGYLVES